MFRSYVECFRNFPNFKQPIIIIIRILNTSIASHRIVSHRIHAHTRTRTPRTPIFGGMAHTSISISIRCPDSTPWWKIIIKLSTLFTNTWRKLQMKNYTICFIITILLLFWLYVWALGWPIFFFFLTFFNFLHRVLILWHGETLPRNGNIEFAARKLTQKSLENSYR